MVANQGLITLTQNGNEIVIKGALGDLHEFASSDPNQGTAKWIGIDVHTGLKSIVGATWNGYTLTQDDEDEALGLGLPKGHIVFWAKAEALAEEPYTIRMTAEGKEDTELTVSFEDEM